MLVPGKMPDLDTASHFIHEGGKTAISTATSSIKYLIFKEEWRDLKTDEARQSAINSLDLSDDKQWANINLIPEGTGLPPEVFERGRPIAIITAETATFTEHVKIEINPPDWT